ncbi:MAG: TonB-dependent receptor [Halioglobus sp.]
MSNQQPLSKHFAVYLACTLGAAVSQAYAQNSAPMLEEIVVTAQKREQSLQDVPISVAVLSEEALQIRGIDTLTDIGANVPNLYVNSAPNSPTSVRMFIRGIGQNDVQLTQDPSVALYLDGVYVGTSIGSGFEGVDVARLEILRGPQGTLYGRNATGGAVNIVTRRANVEDWEFRQDLTTGNLGVFKANTVLNAPLSDKAAVKLNYFHTERDELVENKGPGENFGMKDNDSLVLDLRLDATQDLSFDYRYEKAKGENSQRFEQVTETAPGALSAITTITQDSPDRLDDVASFREIVQNDLEIDAHTLSFTWEASESMTVKSITSSRELDNEYFSDPLSTSVFGVDAAPSYAVSQASFEQFSQEIQLLGSTDALEYVVGLYYYEDDSSQDADGSEILGNLRPTDFSSAENESLAVFGQFTYIPKFMEQRWQITVGGRYSEDNRKAFRDNQIIGFTADYEEDFSNFTPSLTLGFDINDDSNIYGKIVSGFKSGGTSQRSANEQLFAAGFDEEDILSYELGYKGDFWDRRARLNVAVFYMELDGLQSSVQTGSTPGERDFIPTDDNTIEGLELDLTLLLSERLSFSFNYGYLDAEMGQDSADTPAGTFFFTDVFAYAPETNYTASLDYSVPLDNGDLGFNLNYAYKDEVISSINIEDANTIDDYGVWGAAAIWSDISLGNMPGSLKFMLWGKNLGDEEYKTIAIGAWNAFGVSELSTFGDPRSYGLTVSYIY